MPATGSSAEHSERASIIIDMPTLQRQLKDTPPHLLDVRWRLGDPRGHEHYLAGHLPGAVYVDLERELAAPANPKTGRHPLPEIEPLQANARRWGLRTGAPVVVYDDTGGLAAARAWWLLRWAGLNDVRILDGGYSAWQATGYPVATGEVHPAPGDVELSGGHLPVVSIDQVAAMALSADADVLDARAGERYRGETEPVDPRAGHIPGALSAPTTENLTASGAFADQVRLAERFAAMGLRADRALAVYCGSGVTAAHEIAALAAVGIPAALYPGSWSQWSATDRPAATGSDPGAS